MAATPEVYERTPVKATACFSGMATQHAYSTSATRRPLSATCGLSFEPPSHCSYCYPWLVLRVMLVPLTYVLGPAHGWERDYRRPIRAGFQRSALGGIMQSDWTIQSTIIFSQNSCIRCSLFVWE